MILCSLVPTTIVKVRVCTNMTNNPNLLTDKELEDITTVFRSFETGLREATIHPKVLTPPPHLPAHSRTCTRP